MKARFAVLFFLTAIGLTARPKEGATPQEPTVVLPTFVVLGTRIPSGWIEISWECKGPFPISPIKRAWLSKVQADSPAAKAGFKIGDTLLAIGRIPIEQMTGISLHADLKREREIGTREEFTLCTPGEEKRTIVMVFEKP